MADEYDSILVNQSNSNTQMKPLIVLLITFVLAIIVTRVAYNGPDIFLSGRIAMTVMLLFTSIGHFAYTKGMEMMTPPLYRLKGQLFM